MKDLKVHSVGIRHRLTVTLYRIVSYSYEYSVQLQCSRYSVLPGACGR